MPLTGEYEPSTSQRSHGTTGDPCRVFYTDTMHRHRVLWRRWALEAGGFEPGRVWLQADPRGGSRH